MYLISKVGDVTEINMQITLILICEYLSKLDEKIKFLFSTSY